MLMYVTHEQRQMFCSVSLSLSLSLSLSFFLCFSPLGHPGNVPQSELASVGVLAEVGTGLVPRMVTGGSG